ncbi:MAG: hypothetical protein ACKOUT_12720 [Novosphingobium sp.]
MTRSARHYPALLWLLAALAICVRAAVPSGWMPVADQGGIRIEICTGTGSTAMVLERDGSLHEQPAPQAPAPRDPCPFGTAPAMAADLPPVVILPAPPLLEPQEHARASAFAARPFVRGLSPPATGPPQTA